MMSFGNDGECSCISDAIYETYKELYVLYYTPCVIISQVLILNGIGTEHKSKYTPYLHWHYESVDNNDYDIIKDVYDTQYDSSLMSLYKSDISLTSLTPTTTILLQNIGAMSTETKEKPTDIPSDKYIHVGLFGFSILKKYLHTVMNNTEDKIDTDVLEILQKYIKLKSEIINKELNHHTVSIDTMYNEYIDTRQHTCDIVLYEQCTSQTCDPIYRFGICPTVYMNKYECLQIDYYNTCLNSSVSELSNRYEHIAEHYIIDNTLSKIYLKKHNNIEYIKNDSYFKTKIIEKVINPNDNITFELLYSTLSTQHNKTESNNNLNFVIKAIISTIKANEHYEHMNITDIDNNEIMNENDENNEKNENNEYTKSLITTVTWQNSEYTSTIYIREISSQIFNEQNNDNHSNHNIHDLNESNELYKNIKEWVLQHYVKLNEIMTPCLFSHWSLNTTCSLTPCNYTHRCLWFIIDTSIDTSTNECHLPYIDTTFLSMLHNINILQKLIPYKLDELSYMKQRLDFFRYIWQEQIIGKLLRLVDENSGINNTL